MPDYYPRTSSDDVRLAKPPPLHTLRPAAEHARQALIDYGRANPLVVTVATKGARKGKPAAHRVPLEALALPITRELLHPWREVALETLAGSPATFIKAALAAGRTVAAKRAGKHVCVGVKGEGGKPSIRVYWTAGATKGALIDGEAANITAARRAL